MADLSLDCSACGKKFRVTFAVKPKQVSCPQCKARVNTSGETAPAVETAPAGITPPVTDGKAQQSKTQRLPALLKTEDVEFKGWTYDSEAEQARAGLQHADVMGVVWIGGFLLMIGIILFRLLSPRYKIVGTVIMTLGGLVLLAAGYLLMKLKKKGDDSACLRCRGTLGFVHTIPLEKDCKAGKYTRGASGHAYRLENGQAGKVMEVRKKWQVCKACKRYLLVEKEALEFVGTTRADMEKREALYAAAMAAAAEAAAAAAAAAAAVAAAAPKATTVPIAPLTTDLAAVGAAKPS